MSSKIVAVIPARGGSKGIPRKNIQELGGKPIIAYTIEAALRCKMLNRVIVSTDDEEIASIVRRYGVEIIMRPTELATDEAPTEPVIEHAVSWLEEHENFVPEVIVLLQPTSPLRNYNHVEEALNVFFANKYDSLLSVCPSYAFIWRVRKNGAYPINYDFKNRPRRQDKKPEYRENGAIYITKYKILMENHNRLGGKIGLYIMPEESSIEIDMEFDFSLCEQIINSRGK
jgi:N-acylneuraminate cytidylyltransferase